MNAFASFIDGLADSHEGKTRLSKISERGAVRQYGGQHAIIDKWGKGASATAGGLSSLIDQREGAGNYDTLFAHAQNSKFGGTAVSQMTLGDLYKFSEPSGDYGQWVKGELGRSGQEARVATPMGRYQIVGNTLRDAAGELGLPDDTVFSPDVQDQLFGHLARRRLSASNGEAGKLEGIRNEWAGLRNVPDDVLQTAIFDFENQGGRGVRPAR